MTKYADQIAKIEEQLEQKKQRLRGLKAQETTQQRKDDTRRKILYGAAFLTMLEQFTDERRLASLEAIHKAITNPKDRKFLGLELPDGPSNTSSKSGGDQNDQTDNLPLGDFKT